MYMLWVLFLFPLSKVAVLQYYVWLDNFFLNIEESVFNLEENDVIFTSYNTYLFI